MYYLYSVMGQLVHPQHSHAASSLALRASDIHGDKQDHLLDDQENKHAGVIAAHSSLAMFEVEHIIYT